MKPFLYVLTSLLSACISIVAFAQGENNQWCFGQRWGFNFNTNPPSFFETNMRVAEGSASVCDNAGNLLFYSSGANNWDRNGNLMPNGQGLIGNGPVVPSIWPGNIGSSAKGVAIVPNPANSNQYYIIVTDAVEDNTYDAHYSVIDMSLNGGLGDVVPTQKNILLTTNISEGVVATTASGCSGYWAVLHSRFGTEYRAFKIDINGISTTPVVSSGLIGNPTTFVYGYIHFNTEGTKLARSSDEIEMADFNKTTGVLSSFFTLQANQSSGGLVEFSPDDTKLYLLNYQGLRQFNLALLPNVSAVQNTQLLLDTAHYTAIRLGPDNKIYLSGFNDNYFHVINSPDILGAGCQFVDSVYQLPVNVSPQFFFANELGNKVPVNTLIDTFVQTVFDTAICFEESLTLHAPDIYQSYRWFSNAATPEVTVNGDGAYWLHGISNCNLYIDTFKVHFTNFDLNIGSDTNICEGTQITLDATTPDASYRWQDNSALPTYTVVNAGMYKVKVTVGKCSRADSVLVTIMTPFADIIEGDTTICKDQPFTLHGASYPQSNYSWSTGGVTENISITEEGTYILTASNVCGNFTDSVNVETMDCSCILFMPNAFSPNGDDKNEILKARLNCPGITAFTLKIYNRFGQCVFEGNDLGKGWDGYYHNRQADAGTYFYYIQYKNATGTLIKKKGDVVLIR